MKFKKVNSSAHRSNSKIQNSSKNAHCQKQSLNIKKKSENFTKKIVKKKSITFDSDDHSQDNVTSLVDASLHAVTRQTTKRKRHY